MFQEQLGEENTHTTATPNGTCEILGEYTRLCQAFGSDPNVGAIRHSGTVTASAGACRIIDEGFVAGKPIRWIAFSRWASLIHVDQIEFRDELENL